MTEVAKRSKAAPKKRGKGRPVAGKNDVGRERLLAVTEKLLRIMPPARVSVSRVAKEANVDSALVRYYFGNRTTLLLAVVDRVTAHGMHATEKKLEPTLALSDNIRKTVQFVRSANFMHRLMIDELAQIGTEESRARVKSMNLDLVNFYRKLWRVDGGRKFAAADPLFLFLAVLGASDFFGSAEPLIRELVPPDTDMDDLAFGFQEFMVKLVLDGLRKR